MEIVSKAGALTIYRSVPLNWSAIIAGWVMATAIAWVLYILGLAVGFSAVDSSHADTMTRAWGVGTRAWLVMTWAVSLFMGALFASWIDGKAHQTHGLLNGLAVWGLATTVGAILLSLGFSNALQGGASLLKASPEQQTSIVRQLQEEVSEAETEAKAERLARYTAAALWALFFSTVTGAFTAALGGWLGAGHLHRVYDDPIATRS